MVSLTTGFFSFIRHGEVSLDVGTYLLGLADALKSHAARNANGGVGGQPEACVSPDQRREGNGSEMK